MNEPEILFDSFLHDSDGNTAYRLASTGPVTWSQPARVRMCAFWPREATRGLLTGDFGTTAGIRPARLRVTMAGPLEAELRREAHRFHFRLVAPEPARLSVQVAAAWEQASLAPDLRPLLLGLAEFGDAAVERIAGHAPLDALARPVRQRLMELFPGWESGLLPDSARASLDRVTELSDRIWAQAITALEHKCTAAWAPIAFSNEAVTLCEATFEEAPEALAHWDRIRQGELSAAPQLEGFAETWLVELHLPFLNRHEWKTLLDGLRSMDVRADEWGRVLVDPIEPPEAAVQRSNFQKAALLLGSALPRAAAADLNQPTLVFREQRQLSAAQTRHLLARVLERYGLAPLPEPSSDVDVRLTLALEPDARPWLEAPRARSPEYYAAFGEVSRRLQQALRVWAPYCYFADLDRFEDPETAVPMLVYQASRPAAAKAAADFTYDVMNLESVYRALRTAGAVLPEVLRSAAALLEESGRQATAARYRRLDPRAVIQTVKQRPRWFQHLLATDAAVVAEVIQLAMVTRTLRDEPAEAARRLYRALEECTSAIGQRLRRLYGRFSAEPLGALVLIEASRSLAGALGRPATLKALLRWRSADSQADESAIASEVREGGRPV